MSARDQSDAVTQNAWFRCAFCAAISGEISILIQTGAESWGRFPVPRICRWESSLIHKNANNKHACGYSLHYRPLSRIIEKKYRQLPLS